MAGWGVDITLQYRPYSLTRQDIWIIISMLRLRELQNRDGRPGINLIDGMRMRGEILKNAFLSSDADKSLWSSYKWYGAGINKVNLSDENTDKRASWWGCFCLLLYFSTTLVPPIVLYLKCINSLPLKEIFKPIFSPLDVKLLTWNTFWGLSIIW